MTQPAADHGGVQLRVLFFTSRLGGGGAEKHMLHVVNHLDRRRFRPSIVVSRGGGSYEPDLAADVPLHVLDAPRMRGAVRPLRRFLRHDRPDLVCAVMDHANCAALLATIGFAQAPPVVGCVQVPPSIEWGSRTPITKAAWVLALRLLYPRAAAIVALSEGVRRDLAVLVPRAADHLTVIHNAAVDETTERLAAEPPAGAPGGAGPVIVACGRLVTQKGFDVLLDAFALVRRRLPARLWLVGDGDLRAHLERHAVRIGVREAVWFAGFQTNPYAFMRAADVFALSSRWEGFGNVIVEAMAVGTPVVAADCPHGPGEIIQHGINGLLVPPEDAEALAAAIGSVLDDRRLGSRLARAGRARAQAFTAVTIAESYGRLFERIVSPRLLPRA